MNDPISRFIHSKLGIALGFLCNSMTLCIGAFTLKPNIEHGISFKIFASIFCIAMGLFGIVVSVIRARKLVSE